MTQTPQPVDLLIVHGTLITVDAGRRVIEDGALAVAGERIVAVGTSAELCARYTARRDAERAAQGGPARPHRLSRRTPATAC